MDRSSSLFIDAENVYYYLLNNSRRGRISAVDILVELVRGLREHAVEALDAPISIAHAYADFEQMENGTLSSLYLTGVETHNVLGAEHKNAADMRLCIDAMETLYRRPNIGTFILLAGDRDYIPIVQHLKKEGKRVLVVAFRGTLSGDLLQVIGGDNYIDAMTLLSRDSLATVARELRGRRDESETISDRGEGERRDERDAIGFEERREGVHEEPEAEILDGETEARKPGDLISDEKAKEAGDSESEDSRTEEIEESDSAIVNRVGRVIQLPEEKEPARNGVPEGREPIGPSDEFAPAVRLNRYIDREAVILLLKYFGQHDEVWVGPFLRRLSEDLPHLAHHERKAIMDTLIYNGVARLEQRTGYPRDYAVLVLNDDHPDLRELRESVDQGYL